MEYKSSYGIVPFRKEGKKVFYLLIQHSSNFHWGFPRGLKEKGETNQQTALRETKEETGLDINIIPGFKHSFSYLYQVKGQTEKKFVTFFVGEAKTKKVKLSWEHKDYKWLLLEDALKQLDFENTRQTLRKADTFLKKH